MRAVQLRGGDPTEVLAHLRSTQGWTSWPDAPHHPRDPDDRVFTPDDGLDDVLVLYLFDVADRRLDLLQVGPDGPTVQQRIRFADDGQPDHGLGEPDVELTRLPSVSSVWSRRCPERVATAFGAILDELGLGQTVGINVDPAQMLTYALQVGTRSVHVQADGRSWHRAFWSDGAERPFPEDLRAWVEPRAASWSALCEALGLDAEVDESGAIVHFRKVVSTCTHPIREIGLDDARDIDPGFDVGDDLGTRKRPHMVWNWLFDQVWNASHGEPLPAA